MSHLSLYYSKDQAYLGTTDVITILIGSARLRIVTPPSHYRHPSRVIITIWALYLPILNPTLPATRLQTCRIWLVENRPPLTKLTPHSLRTGAWMSWPTQKHKGLGTASPMRATRVMDCPRRGAQIYHIPQRFTSNPGLKAPGGGRRPTSHTCYHRKLIAALHCRKRPWARGVGESGNAGWVYRASAWADISLSNPVFRAL